MTHVMTPKKFLHELRREVKLCQTFQLLIRGIIRTQVNTSTCQGYKRTIPKR